MDILIDFNHSFKQLNLRKVRFILEQAPGRQIWYQYWDYCIRNEEDFWRHFNYIHHNLVKHRDVKEQALVANYPFSSYKTWLERKGEEWLNDCFAQYPILDFTKEEDDF